MDWKDTLASLRPPGPGADEQPASKPQPTVRPPARRESLEVLLDRKGRKGKEATIIAGFATDDGALEAARELKKALGVGGSARGGEVLLQGDKRQEAAGWLQRRGHKTKIR